jgi:hypothetical protein
LPLGLRHFAQTPEALHQSLLTSDDVEGLPVLDPLAGVVADELGELRASDATDDTAVFEPPWPAWPMAEGLQQLAAKVPGGLVLADGDWWQQAGGICTAAIAADVLLALACWGSWTRSRRVANFRDAVSSNAVAMATDKDELQQSGKTPITWRKLPSVGTWLITGPTHAAAQAAASARAEQTIQTAPADTSNGPTGRYVRHQFAAGDRVQLDRWRAPPAYRGHDAIITHQDEDHCTVTVLEETGRFGIGECWPFYADISLRSKILRLRSRVVIDGASGKRLGKLNGKVGTVVAHPHSGHPPFIEKLNAENPQLMACVKLDDPENKLDCLVMVEPRNLVPHADFLERTTSQLKEMSESLKAQAPSTRQAGAGGA